MQNNSEITNPYLKVKKPDIGVLDAPDGHYKPVLYSHIEATKEYNQLEQDLYQKMKKIKKPEKDTPKSVFAFLGVGALLVAIPRLCKLFKK
ncbi:MAG: hypothetical protein R3Y28_04575 [Candidatus Gastranaerophilales bacterium]